jgi:crotonobetainyl-CoA:carnitine CoA-transferase CaiB-like acyl-CoA transferase
MVTSPKTDDRGPAAARAGPLVGLRILDMTSVVMGPFATQILGDLGADVIKIEPPSGDTTRHVTPMRNPNMGWVYLQLNRSKRSLVLDLKHPEGIAALLKLVAGADVLLTNVRPQALDRLGLTWSTLSHANPRLIYMSLVGYGSGGPYAGRPAYEDLIQGLTAIPSILVEAGSEQPHYVPSAFNDRGVGLHSAILMLSAVLHRQRTGRGQQIEVPMFETMVHSILGDHMGGEAFQPPLGPPGYKRTLTKERRPYPTSDGYICVIIYTDKHWQAYLQLIGKGDLFRSDPRFANIGTRTDHSHDLYAYVSEQMSTKSTAEWLDLLLNADIPATPLHTLNSLLEDPHLLAQGFFRTVEHPSEGHLREMAIPSRWSDCEPKVVRPAPRLGEHSREVLKEAGLTDNEIDELIKARTAVQAS